MSCQTVQRFISPYLDRALGEEERNRVTQHLANCRECAARSEQLRHLRAALRTLPVAAPPARLLARLQSLAAYERARRLSQLSATARHWTDRVRLFADNLMRPLALPFAGGLVSALLLFGTLVPTLVFQINLRNDVPTAFYTEASLVETGPFGFIDEDTTVEVTLDERGQITNVSVPYGKTSKKLETDIATLLMFSRFAPATLFGQPTSGRVLVSFRRSSIVIRG
jgi:hypothetical protein